MLGIIVVSNSILLSVHGWMVFCTSLPNCGQQECCLIVSYIRRRRGGAVSSVSICVFGTIVNIAILCKASFFISPFIWTPSLYHIVCFGSATYLLYCVLFGGVSDRYAHLAILRCIPWDQRLHFPRLLSIQSFLIFSGRLLHGFQFSSGTNVQFQLW